MAIRGIVTLDSPCHMLARATVAAPIPSKLGHVGAMRWKWQIEDETPIYTDSLGQVS
jgi:hypothetical protein